MGVMSADARTFTKKFNKGSVEALAAVAAVAASIKGAIVLLGPIGCLAVHIVVSRCPQPSVAVVNDSLAAKHGGYW